MYNNNAVAQVYLKAAQPKATHSFERAGEYILQVRDITSRYGNPNYRYRILVRPQIPHVGEISVIPKEKKSTRLQRWPSGARLTASTLCEMSQRN